MGPVNLGDMARALQTRRGIAAAAQEVGRLSAELASGRKADIAAATGGDMTALAAIARARGRVEAHAAAAAEAAAFAGAAQAALGTIGDTLSGFGPRLLGLAATSSPAAISASARDARLRLDAIVSALNVAQAGRHVFSGTATDTPPLAAADDILGQLTAAAAGQTTVAGVIAAVDAWFDAAPGGGGFADTGYLGGTVPLAPFRIGDRSEDVAAVATTAADPALRAALRAAALGALVDAGVLAGDVAAQGQLLREAGAAAIAAGDGITGLAAATGTAEERIAAVRTRLGAEGTALDLAHAAIAAADPYDTASALSEAERRLELVYAVTARLARLSLAEYLR
ncbi:MAG: flagellin [Rhodobacteraceae bacterium]|nr:flagellin [Paracoccaceae bacterium]